MENLGAATLLGTQLLKYPRGKLKEMQQDKTLIQLTVTELTGLWALAVSSHLLLVPFQSRYCYQPLL